MLLLSDFHSWMCISPILPLSHGTLCSRFSAAELSMSHSCARDQPGRQATKVALTLLQCLSYFHSASYSVCFDYGHLGQRQEIWGSSIWKNKLMKSIKREIILQMCFKIIFTIPVFRRLEFLPSMCCCRCFGHPLYLRIIIHLVQKSKDQMK